MKKRYLMLAVVLPALLVGAGWLAALMINAAREGRQWAVVLADGSRLTLLGMAVGSQPFTTEKPWHKTARRWLPRPWQGWLPDPASSTGSGDSNSLTVFFTLTGPQGAVVPSVPWSWFEATADDGSRFPVSGGGGSFSAGRTRVQTIVLRAFPRRQTEFDLHFFDNNWLPVGSIRLPNPIRGPFPEWTPERLPVCRTNGPLVVTLESLTERTNAAPPYSSWTSIKWRMETTDPLWRGAKPRYQEWSDATGNRGGRLAWDERAWKLELPFQRPDGTNYLDAEKFVLPGITLPGPGTFQLFTNEFERLGVKFKVRCLAGAGTLMITNGTGFGMNPLTGSGGGWGSTSDGRGTIESWSSLKPFFLIEASEPGALDELRFLVVGSDGKELPLESNGWYGSAKGGRRYQQRFYTTNTTDTFALEGIVSRARLIEFVIDPAEIRRAGK